MNNIVVIDPRVIVYLSIREKSLYILKHIIKEVIKDAPTISLADMSVIFYFYLYFLFSLFYLTWYLYHFV